MRCLEVKQLTFRVFAEWTMTQHVIEATVLNMCLFNYYIFRKQSAIPTKPYFPMMTNETWYSFFSVLAYVITFYIRKWNPYNVTWDKRDLIYVHTYANDH